MTYPAVKIPIRITIRQSGVDEPLLTNDVTVLAGNDIHAESIGHEIAAVLLMGWAHTGVTVGGTREVSVVCRPDRKGST